MAGDQRNLRRKRSASPPSRLSPDPPSSSSAPPPSLPYSRVPSEAQSPFVVSDLAHLYAPDQNLTLSESDSDASALGWDHRYPQHAFDHRYHQNLPRFHQESSSSPPLLHEGAVSQTADYRPAPGRRAAVREQWWGRPTRTTMASRPNRMSSLETGSSSHPSHYNLQPRSQQPLFPDHTGGGAASPTYSSSDAEMSEARRGMAGGEPPLMTHAARFRDAMDSPLENPFPSPQGPNARVSYPFPDGRHGGASSGVVPHKPLISYIKNEWRRTTTPGPSASSFSSSPYAQGGGGAAAATTRPRSWTGSSGPDDSELFPAPECCAFFRSKAFRRYLLVNIVLGILCWVGWASYLSPNLEYKNFLRESVRQRQTSEKGWFGQNKRVGFEGMSHIMRLNSTLVPGSGLTVERGRRLIIIGDIHGCLDELQALLSQVSYNPQTDHIIATGDTISRGPESPAVLDLLMSKRASCVRGNHEDRIILAHRDLRSPSHRKFTTAFASPSGPGAAAGSKTGHHTATTIKNGAASDLQLADTLSDDHVRYLSSCPLILDLGVIEGLGPTHVVHAGLVPGVPLAQQDPSAVMTMRSIDLRSHYPSKRPAPPRDPSKKTRSERSRRNGVRNSNNPNNNNNARQQNSPTTIYDDLGRMVIAPWSELWNAHQEMQPRAERATVVYGHDSARGLQVDRYSFGLDGGCVAGGKLAALVVQDGGGQGAKVKTRVETVGCKNYKAEREKKPPVGLGAS